MKKLVLFSILALSVGSYNASAFEFGALGGVNIAMGDINLNNTSLKSSSVSNFTFGLSSHFDIAPLFGIDVDALYQPRGYAATATLGSYTVLGSAVVDYLTVPLMLRVEIIPGFLRVGAGGYASFAMSDVNITESGLSTKATRASRNWVNSDFGLTASLRGTLPVVPGFLDLVADVRYQLGLSDIETSGVTDAKLRDLSILGGLTLKL